MKKVDIVVGERDQRTGNYAVGSGLRIGDKLLRNPNVTLKDGQKVTLSKVATATVATAVSHAASVAASTAVSKTETVSSAATGK